MSLDVEWKREGVMDGEVVMKEMNWCELMNCLRDTLVPKCLDLQQTFIATIVRTEVMFNITRYYY